MGLYAANCLRRGGPLGFITINRAAVRRATVHTDHRDSGRVQPVGWREHRLGTARSGFTNGVGGRLVETVRDASIGVALTAQ